jgi:serine/threonine protein kinase
MSIPIFEFTDLPTSTTETNTTGTNVTITDNILNPDEANAIITKENDTKKIFFERSMDDIIAICNSMNTNGYVDIKKFFSKIQMKIKIYSGGSSNYNFKVIDQNRNIKFVIRMAPYAKNSDLTNMSVLNVESQIAMLLNEFCTNNQTPHIITYFTMFHTNIEHFVRIPDKILKGYCKKIKNYGQFISQYKRNEFENNVSVIIYEWCDGGNLLDYIRTHYKNLTLNWWINIFFQLLFTLAIIHTKYPAFRHNDLKPNNILLKTTTVSPTSDICRYRYNISNKFFYIKDIGLQIKIGNFDLACIDGIVENTNINSPWCQLINITHKENKYYDTHYFLNTLANKNVFPQFYEGGAPAEIVEFVNRAVPEKYRNGSKFVNEIGRIQVDDEYTTPYKLIMEDPLFDKWRYELRDEPTC